MNISFWLTSTTREMTKENWGKAPMGGAEISAVNLGRELLKLGHEVNYFLQRAQPFDDGSLHVKQHDQLFNEDLEYFICVRPHPVLQGDFRHVKKILWSGDAYDQPSNEIFYNKNITESMDGYVFKSNWQRDKILEKYFTINSDKTHVIYNGVKEEYFSLNGILPQPKRFIHTSLWYRGVENFIDIWPIILSEIPDAEIHVFSKATLYSEVNSRDSQGWYGIAERLCQYPGMILREPVPQRILIQEMQKSWLMLYPNSGFVESSCGSALESISVGTPVITTNRAGLPETVGENGVLIEQNDGEWKEKFAKETVELYKDTERRQRMAKMGRQHAMSQTWNKKATEWEDFLKSL